jgi:hypothetical protein
MYGRHLKSNFLFNFKPTFTLGNCIYLRELDLPYRLVGIALYLGVGFLKYRVRI